MKPSQVAMALRHIASAIQASKNPDRKLVARDLKKIISVLLNKPRELVHKKFVEAWKKITEPFRDLGVSDEPLYTDPKQIPSSKRIKYIDFGDGLVFVLKAQPGVYDNKDEYSIILDFMNPITKSVERVYTGPKCTLGITKDEFAEMVDAASDIMNNNQKNKAFDIN
jgi:hypothetical protein